MSMGIDWTALDIRFPDMEEIFMAMGQTAITKNHYELSKTDESIEAGLTAANWRAFINDGRVRAYIQEEFDTIEGAELRKLVDNVGTSRSVGQAQIISALNRRQENKSVAKSGPAFIYCYVPPTEEQQHAPNIVPLTHDPFMHTSEASTTVIRLITQTTHIAELIPDPAVLAALMNDIEAILLAVYAEETEVNTDATT